MLLIFHDDICQALPIQKILLIVGWYNEDAMWKAFFNKLQYLI